MNHHPLPRWNAKSTDIFQLGDISPATLIGLPEHHGEGRAAQTDKNLCHIQMPFQPGDFRAAVGYPRRPNHRATGIFKIEILPLFHTPLIKGN